MSVTYYLTNTDQSAKFTQQSSLSFSGSASSSLVISMDKNTTYQTIDGFGCSLTEGSAEVISSLDSTSKSNLLNELFHPTNGIGISVIRLPIGACDLSSADFTYQELKSAGTTATIWAYITLQSVSNNMYVSSENGSNAMNCTRSSAGSWETFQIIDAGNGLIALRGTNNKYVTGSSPMYCNASSIGSAQSFKWVCPTSGQVQLQCSSNGYYVSSENGYGSMNCNRSSPSGWETFWVKEAHFSLSGLDSQYTFPILKEILAINPDIKIIATPWTAPTWMKSNYTWIGGSLQTTYYQTYAQYFLDYLNAMKNQGINIYAVSPQNEPENPYNEPSLTMTSTEEANFISNNLGPTLKNGGFSNVKIICFDHNCDHPDYPIDVCNNAGSWVDGSAFHLYSGDISALSTVHQSTGKNVYFTEQYTSSTGDFGGDFDWHLRNVMIGSMMNWAKCALEWNLATNSSFGPHTPKGSSNSKGALTISGGQVTRNVAYYIIAHMSKFVRPNSKRINSWSSYDGGLSYVAFTSGSNIVLVVLNNNGSTTSFSVNYNGKYFSTSLKAGSGATFSWSSNGDFLTQEDSSLSGLRLRNTPQYPHHHSRLNHTHETRTEPSNPSSSSFSGFPLPERLQEQSLSAFENFLGPLRPLVQPFLSSPMTGVLGALLSTLVFIFMFILNFLSRLN